MIDYELFAKIRHLKEHEGLTAPQIAAELAIDVRTVRKWLTAKFRPKKITPRPSKLDPFKRDIVRMLETHPYTATQIFQRICEQGFDGGYSIVKRYVRKIRPPKSPAFLKLSFAPGECAQVDWGSYGAVNVGSTRRRLSFFVMVLCYSRMMYVEFTVSQTMEHFLGCHQNAFDFFGSVPKKIMVDNLKSAVLKRIVGQAPALNPKYLDFANHYGFSIAPCNIGKGNEKGRVENGVGYVKKNFLAGLHIPDFSAIGPAARNWLDTIANVRIHGETRQKPLDLVEKERPFLNSLPANPFDVATVSQVRASSQFRITIDTNHYSVPAEYAGTRLILKAYPDRLCVYCKDKLIARPVRSYDRYQDFEDPDHPKELLNQRKKARDQKIFMRFLALSPKAEQYYRKLEQRRMNPHHHVRKIVALSEIYDPDAVARAMEDAFTFEAFSSEYIANLLEQRSRSLPEPGALHLTRREDLLDIKVEQPDLAIYERNHHE
uniref:IS21 family transposase n=1 Tax=Candidatus Desulfatibia profunda TaxID=2841695 RepID=A0A8J6NQN4_9BACT|nr:IS21 family transposase [Candidatus Desulfatibia profunda]